MEPPCPYVLSKYTFSYHTIILLSIEFCLKRCLVGLRGMFEKSRDPDNRKRASPYVIATILSSALFALAMTFSSISMAYCISFRLVYTSLSVVFFIFEHTGCLRGR